MSFKMLFLVFSTLFVFCSCEPNANDLINSTINELELGFLKIVHELSRNEQEKMLYSSMNQEKINKRIQEYYKLNIELQKTSPVPLFTCIIDANRNIGNYQNSLFFSCFIDDAFKDEVTKLQGRIWEFSIVSRVCKGDENCVKDKIENMRNDWYSQYEKLQQNIDSFQRFTLTCIDSAALMSMKVIQQAETALTDCLKH